MFFLLDSTPTARSLSLLSLAFIFTLSADFPLRRDSNPVTATHGMNVHTVISPTQYAAIDPSSAANEMRKGSADEAADEETDREGMTCPT